jgi:hypothetical protein
MKLDCNALQAEIDRVRTELQNARSKSGVRMVRDSDGSTIEYNSAALASLEAYLRRLELEFDTLCGNCLRSTGPFGFVFP